MGFFKNIGEIFTGAYLHYKETPKETMFESSIVERLKSRKEKANQIKIKEENINNDMFKKYFTNYQTQSNIYNKLIDPENVRINKIQVDSIKKTLNRIKKSVEKVPKKYKFRIKENEEIIDIVEKILEINNKIQQGQGLKILTPHQMLSRLPITLAQLKAANNSENLKKEIRHLSILCTNKKNLQKICMKIRSTLFKHGNNLYEH